MLNDLKVHKHKVKIVFGLCIILLVISVFVFAFFRFFDNRSEGPVSHVNLGPLEYTLSGDNLTKRTDESIRNLRSFLENLNATSGCSGDVYHTVLAVSPDEQQILLRYGCDHPNARMFAVKKDGQWHALSSTNQFDQFGIPRCEHTDPNNISRTIAPVCVQENTAFDPTYIVR